MVIVGRRSAVAPRTYDDPPAVRGVKKRVLLGPRQGAPHFAMRHFSLAPGGYSPEHSHPWEHEVYILSGQGRVRFSDGAREVGPDDFVLVPPMDKHQFLNVGNEPFEFICVVPLAGDDG